MNILIACEESQTVCIEMRRLGHESYSCDIQECSGGHPEFHIKGDVLPLINGKCEFVTMDGTRHEIPEKWDMIIAHPPCTYLSNAGACRLYPVKGQLDILRFEKGIAAKDFFLKFLNADCDKIAVENPISSRVFGLPPFSQVIQPFEYGDPFIKKTCLWLKGLSLLEPTDIVEPLCSWISGGSKKADGTPRYNQGTKIRDSKLRSKTFPGIARAMAEQWCSNYIPLQLTLESLI